MGSCLGISLKYKQGKAVHCLPVRQWTSINPITLYSSLYRNYSSFNRRALLRKLQRFTTLRRPKQLDPACFCLLCSRKSQIVWKRLKKTTMEVENNNNNAEAPTKKLTEKRPASCVPDNDVSTIKKKKYDVPESNGREDIHVLANSTIQVHQVPKKRLQLQNKNKNNSGNKVKYNKKEAFLYGNYKHYYGKRILDKDFHDIRLDVLTTQQELFHDKQVLDIGCNSGHLSIEIAKQFKVKSLVGLDIDRSLTQDAQLAINNLKRDCNKPATGSFPYNVRFVHGNYVLDDDVLLEIERPQYDVILCLSVTKWIHLNFCDAGLKQAFRRMFLQLRPGGKLILEPQSFDTYKRRKKLTDKIRENYDAINFKPDDFTAYLLGPEVGFASMELLGLPEHCKAGFKRPIQIFSKVSS